MTKRIITFILVFVVLLAGISLFSRKPREAAKPLPAIKGRIAIVLDDWGYNLNNLRAVKEIKYPLTLAVLPDLAYSRRVADEFRARGFEVILHLPMEPEEKLRLEKNTIRVSADQAQIARILDQSLANIGRVSGISNHMGSKATSDPRTMEIVFKELKKRRLYFLDSYVTARSVGADLARKTGLKIYKRDVFLDNTNEREYIRQQVYKLRDKARTQGFAIGIGHDRKITLEVLREMMPGIAREGYRFVLLSELQR
ncbi:MAG: divergent polysaccharide deacetylase family protein [Candidatus Omnitrophota bacterium]